MTRHRVEMTDVLILGGGVAGLRAALSVCDAPQVSEGPEILVLTKAQPQTGSSGWAQGGVAAALEGEEAVRSHEADTLLTGRGLCRPEAVRVLVEEGPARIRELLTWGARFDRVDGALALTREGGHSRSRVLHAGGDATGKAMVRALLTRLRQAPRCHWQPDRFAVDLLLDEGRCVGAVVLDEAHGGVTAIGARAVILATGGAGQVYARTTNPGVATGDGLAMALRAGAVASDMEFVQFHPTAFSRPRAPAFLLTEVLRGEGGILRNASGEAFLARYHEAGDLAPRDLVAQAVWEEMRRTGEPQVWLDLTHLGRVFLARRFPTIVRLCRRYGVDPGRVRIPVAPAAHFMMGGVETDLWGQTGVEGLYACGEVACVGVHGANRLGSNSLLEGLVYGARAGQAVTAALPRRPSERRIASLVRAYRQPASSSPPMPRLRHALRRLMWEEVGLVRTKGSLDRAISRLLYWERQMPAAPYDRSACEAHNLLTVALAIGVSALARQESVGAHFRQDAPRPSGTGVHHVRVRAVSQHPLQLSTLP